MIPFVVYGLRSVVGWLLCFQRKFVLWVVRFTAACFRCLRRASGWDCCSFFSRAVSDVLYGGGMNGSGRPGLISGKEEHP